MSFNYIGIHPKKGRCVFAGKDYKKGDLIEIAPMLVITGEEMEIIQNTMLYDYYFEWYDDSSALALALGHGSLYNHSSNANVDYEADYELDILTFRAYKPIKKDEELTINYHQDPDSKEPVWFDVH